MSTAGKEVEIVPGNLTRQNIFAQEAVKMLNEADFDLASDTKINIRYKECMLVLFYGDNIESRNLAEIWGLAAKQVAGPVFAACNLMVSKRVAEGFTSLNMQGGSLHWARLKGLPFILTYQNGWPVGFYNGERAVQPIIDYSLVLACRSDYHEPINLFGGLQSDKNLNFEMKSVNPYGDANNPRRTDSGKFKVDSPVRTYDPDDKIVLAGTAPAKAEAAQENVEEAQAGEAQAGAQESEVPAGTESSDVV